MNTREKTYRSGGNVFADIGLAHPERVMARAQVMLRITAIIRERGLTQKEAAQVLGIPQSKVSCLMAGKLSLFSLDRLFQFLNALDREIEIVIRPSATTGRSAMTHVVMTV
ncbi:MAG: helix-turn-helix transcriptional regulator [Candidatus Omnitrophota bacterium]